MRAVVIVYVGAVPFDPDPRRYERMEYRRCGRSGLKLPLVSLGLWHNFGGDDPLRMAAPCSAGPSTWRHPFRSRQQLRAALRFGGGELRPDPERDLAAHRDELVVSTKAGYDMWPGPYGDGGSRKYLMASLDASLRRMGLDYVDIFYPHRPDPETPLEETMGALEGRCAGQGALRRISSYPPEQTEAAAGILDGLGTRLLIHQPPYSMFNRWIEHGLLDTFGRLELGCIVFLAAVAGSAHRPLPAGGAGRVAGQSAGLTRPEPARRADPRQGAGPRRCRPGPRPDHGADGAGVDRPRPG